MKYKFYVCVECNRAHASTEEIYYDHIYQQHRAGIFHFRSAAHFAAWREGNAIANFKERKVSHDEKKIRDN